MVSVYGLATIFTKTTFIFHINIEKDHGFYCKCTAVHFYASATIPTVNVVNIQDGEFHDTGNVKCIVDLSLN